MENSELIQEQTGRRLLLVFAQPALSAAFTICERDESWGLFPDNSSGLWRLAVQIQVDASLGRQTMGTICLLKTRTDHERHMTGELDFENLVNLYYASLYRFALSLTRKENDACDLTQQTFYVWAAKGHQLQDASKVKTWLFTTLHRLFLEMQRRHHRFPHHELTEVSSELPNVDPQMVTQLDSAAVVGLLAKVEAPYQAPVALFYLEDYSYKEIAEILAVPIGTVKSRIARGIAQLQKVLSRDRPSAEAGRNGAS